MRLSLRLRSGTEPYWFANDFDLAGHELCHLCIFRDHVWVMNMNLEMSRVVSDEQLWRLASDGDREAFTRIVERYQSLICSLAYSACGALGTSEDMAQETFITAWRRLRDLREPSKLRQWLCGIVRTIAGQCRSPRTPPRGRTGIFGRRR